MCIRDRAIINTHPICTKWPENERIKNWLLPSIQEIFKEKLSGSNIARPELRKLLYYIRKGDTVTVTKLDRLARSTKDLLSIAEEIKKKGADFEVLNINLDTKSPTGQLMLTMLAAIAEFEKGIMLERQREGIDVAKEDGRYKAVSY